MVRVDLYSNHNKIQVRIIIKFELFYTDVLHCILFLAFSVLLFYPISIAFFARALLGNRSVIVIVSASNSHFFLAKHNEKSDLDIWDDVSDLSNLKQGQGNMEPR